MIGILHLHGYKCAGTAFSSVLQVNFGHRVRYVESEGKGDRLPWQALHEALDLTELRAVTSHLVTLPPPEAGLARMHVAFVRDPRERIRSAYRLEKRRGSLNRVDLSFAEYVGRVGNSVLANYQTRHLSPQDDNSWAHRNGWQLRPELIDLDRRDLFVGVVERFDESLVVLEHRLMEHGVPFDAPYARAFNAKVGNDDPLDDEPLEGTPLGAVELDESLCEWVQKALDRGVQEIAHFDERLADFRRRRRRRRRSAKRGNRVSIPGSGSWTYVSRADSCVR